MEQSTIDTTVSDGSVLLFVDLDGTLLRTDTLFETFFAALRANGPIVVWKAVSAFLAGGRANLKQSLSSLVTLEVDTLPGNDEFVSYLVEEKQRGRPIWLATAADRSIAEQVSDSRGLFDGVVASSGDANMKGRRKLEAIRTIVGDAQFDYAGDSKADLPIWKEARQAIVVNATSSVRRRVAALGNLSREFEPRKSQFRALLNAMRPYQWVKNTLVFVPMITTLSADVVARWPGVVLAFASFCVIASGTYLLNDLLDLQADRRHPRKRNRPMASGAVTIPSAAAAFVGLVLAGIVIAVAVNQAFLLVILTYLLLTVSYSTAIKTYVIGDVIALAALYTLRLLGGAAAVGTFPSVWLIGFSMFIFFSLALVKRCAELEMLTLEDRDGSAGRDYRVSDVNVLYSLGASFGAVGILVFVLYVADPAVAARFASPSVLWLIAVCLIYWLSRLWIKTARGEMTDDPIVFTMRDRGTRKLLLIAGVLFAVAAFVDLGSLFSGGTA